MRMYQSQKVTFAFPSSGYLSLFVSAVYIKYAPSTQRIIGLPLSQKEISSGIRNPRVNIYY